MNSRAGTRCQENTGCPIPVTFGPDSWYWPAKYEPDGEHRDADDAVGAVPVPARQQRHQPGEPLGEEPERARDRGVLMVDVGQHPRPGAERHPGRQVRVAHVQRRRERGEDEGAAQRVIPAHHGAAQLPASRMNCRDCGAKRAIRPPRDGGGARGRRRSNGPFDVKDFRCFLYESIPGYRLVKWR